MISMASRILALSFAAALCLQAFAPLVSRADAAENGPAYQYFSKDNAPTFYGTTAIRVPEGTVVDYLHDARFRVLVRDNEDFDLTGRVQVISSGFDPTQPLASGSYEIGYSVTDSDGNTVRLTVPVTAEPDGKEIWLEKTMYTLPSVDHLNGCHYNRGNNHDRQMIGVFLDDSEENDKDVPSIQIRKTSGSSNLTLTFRGNNGWCERDYTISGVHDYMDSGVGWATFRNEGKEKADSSLASVPFVKTVYKATGDVVYEVKWDAGDQRIKPLHYYHEDDGPEAESAFFQEWGADEGSYAVIDGVTTTVLMPYADCAVMMPELKKYHLETIDKALKFWTTVLDGYDALLGISYEPEYYWDQAVKTKYFARANKHGAGSAYYDPTDCFGMNNDKNAYHLLIPEWGTFHEYGHGYQGDVGEDDITGLDLGEVSVNIYSYWAEELSDFGEPYNQHWIGDIDTMEDNWAKVRAEGNVFKNNKCTLYMLLNALLSTDDYVGASAQLHQYYRKYLNTTGLRHTILDTWVLAMEEKYNINLIPYFEAFGGTISDEVKEHMMASDAEVMYFIRDTVATQEKAAELKGKYGQKGEYDLIRMSELKSENITGSVKVRFNIPDIETIKGKYLTVNNGGETVERVPVTGEEISFTLPAGVYKAAPPISSDNLSFDRFYMTVVGDGTAEYEVEYKDFGGLANGNDIVIYSTGYWGESNHPFTVQVKNGKMQFDYQDTYPLSGHMNQETLFTKLTLTSAAGEQIYEKSVNGGIYPTFGSGHYEFDVAIGDKLTIYYNYYQADNIRYVSQLTGERVEGFANPNRNVPKTYVVTEYGLVPEEMLEADPNAAYELFKERIAQKTQQILDEVGPEGINDPFKGNSELVNRLTKMVSGLTAEDQADYAGIFPGGTSQPSGGEGGGPTVTGPDGRMVTPNKDGTVTAPKRSVVTPRSGGPDITLPDGGSVDKDGSITLPGGGNAKIGENAVTMPQEGGIIQPKPDGSVNLPGGAIVKDGGGNVTVLPGTGGAIVSDGTLLLLDAFHSYSGSEVTPAEEKAGGAKVILCFLLIGASVSVMVMLTGRKRKKVRRHRKWSEE